MFKTHLLIALRNLFKRKGPAFVSIFGLALGISASLVIWQYVSFELSYDQFHVKRDRIYRTLFTDFKNGEKIDSSPKFGYELGPSLKNDLPEVKTFVRTHGLFGNEAVVSFEDDFGSAHQFLEKEILFVDSTFLDVFTAEVLLGNGEIALDDPSSVVISESVAKRYFGEGANPVGKNLNVFTQDWVKGDYQITAVILDYPDNSHLNFDFLIPMHDLLQTANYKQPRAGWNWVNFTTYVEVYPNTDVGTMNAKTDALLTKYTGPNEPGSFVFTFQPLREIHISENEDNKPIDIGLYVMIALCILVLSWINYANLSTAGATQRAKEVGIKKAIGVGRAQLISQFLTESLLINFISLVVALVISAFTLPLVETILEKDLSAELTDPRIWIALLAILTFGTVLSGVYPAFVMSSIRAINIARGYERKKSTISLRNALVVFQFIISLLFIAGTYTVYRQIDFMRHLEKGMDVSQMWIVDAPTMPEGNNADERLISFKHELGNIASVSDVTSSGSIPGKGFSYVSGMVKLGAEKEPTQIETIYTIFSEHDFAKAYGIELTAGRMPNINRDDDNHVLINEAALAPFDLGNAEQALDEKLVIGNADTVTVVGVFRNIHWSSMHTAHVPMLLWPERVSRKHFSLRLTGDLERSIAQVEALYKKHFPGNPFNHYFLDDFFDQQYREDQTFEKILSLFSIIAVVIACLGLAGLGAYITAQRTKEIGIRKVLGASFTSIIALLGSQLLRLLTMASIISLPLCWYATDQWLSNFAFHIHFSTDMFLIPCVILFMLVLFTVSIQVCEGASINPAKVLKNE